EVSLVGHGYLLRGVLGHEVGQQPVQAAPAPVDRRLGDAGPGRHSLDRGARVAVVDQFADDGLQDRGAGARGPPAWPEAAWTVHHQKELQLRLERSLDSLTC